MRSFIVLWIGLFSLCLSVPALANEQTAKRELLLATVTLNHKKLARVHRVYVNAKHVWVQEDELLAWGLKSLPLEAVPIDDGRYYDISNIAGVDYTVDRYALELAVNLPTEQFKNNRYDRLITPMNAALRPKESGAYLNYDVFSQHQSTWSPSQLSGTSEANYFNHFGIGSYQMYFNNQSQANSLTRLMTTWTFDKPENIASWRFGDSITGSTNWSGAVRLGGLQYATNFNTQPELVTYPLPSFKGVAVVPSTVDVMVNNQLQSQYQVESGNYALNNIPVVTGAGTLSIVSRDLLGKEQMFVLPYYVSDKLLAPGLSDFSYELGAIRQNFTIDSNNYGALAAVGTHYYGMNPCYTLGGHAEFSQAQQTFGVGQVYLFRQQLLFTLASAVSHANEGLGGLLSAGVGRHVRAGLSFGAQAVLTSKDYKQLSLLNNPYQPTLNSRVYWGYNFVDNGSLSMSYTKVINDYSNTAIAIQPNANIWTLSYSQSFFKRWQLVVSGYTNGKNTQDNQLFLSLVWTMDKDKIISVGGNAQPGNSMGFVEVNKNIPFGNGLGYRVAATTDRVQGNVGLNTDNIALQAGAYQFDNQQNYQLEARGSMLYFDKHLFLARNTDSSFALVDTDGYQNVRVYYRNQLIGRTDKHGLLLIPELLPYQQNELVIEPRDLPINAELASTSRTIVPYYKSGALAKFRILEKHPKTLRLHLDNEGLVPPGAMLWLEHSDIAYPVGYQGVVYFDDLPSTARRALVAWGEGKLCSVRLTPQAYQDNKMVDIVCKVLKK